MDAFIFMILVIAAAFAIGAWLADRMPHTPDADDFEGDDGL